MFGFNSPGTPKGLAKDLKKLIGNSPAIKVEKFQNWASTQVVKEALTVRPRSVEEVQAVIRAAGKLGLQVRAVGEAHSWTQFFHSGNNKELIMYVGDIERPDGGPRIELQQDPTGKNGTYVTVLTGVTTGEFLKFQLQYGVTIPANAILRAVTMGGLVAGACHGVGRDVQTISDRVVRMRVVDSRGELRTYSMDEDPDMMRALQCNLGLWGIIIDITMKVDQMMIVETENRWLKVKDVFYDKENFRKIITENWSVEVFWFPFNGISKWEALEAFVQKKIDEGEWEPEEDEVLLRIVNKPVTPGPVVGDKMYEATDFRDWMQAKHFDNVDEFVSSHPEVAPSFLRKQIAVLKESYGEKVTQQLPHAVHFRDYVQAVPVYDMEFAFSVDEDCTNLCHATQKVVELVYAEAKEGRFPMNMPLEMRFIADSDAYIAPAICGNKECGGSGLTCYIEVITVAGTPGWEEYCTKVYEIWKDLQGARPHWCKEWSFLPDIEQFIRQAYGDQIPKFLEALDRSAADPKGMFFPSRLEKVFYPEGHPGKSSLLPNPGSVLDDMKEKDCSIL